MTPPATPRRAHTLGYVAEALLYAGAFLLLFVVWQVFYTDVQANRTQRALIESMEWIEIPSVVAPQVDDSHEGVTAPVVVELIPPELMFTDDAPIVDQPDHADSFAALHVPRWGQDYVTVISEGITRRDVLDVLGIGHYPDSALPGQPGNFSIAGHRTSYGKPFSHIDTLQVGDALIVSTEDAWYVYSVTTWQIVQPDAVEVVAPTPGILNSEPSGRFITLTACHPRYSAAQRWVVHGELEYWAPGGHGFPPEMVEVLS